MPALTRMATTAACALAAAFLAVAPAAPQAYVDQVTLPTRGPAYVGQVPPGAVPVVPVAPKQAPRGAAPPKRSAPSPVAQSLIIPLAAGAIDPRPGKGSSDGAAGQQGPNAGGYPSVGNGVVLVIGSPGLDGTLPKASLGQ
ncbi:hypothetical protein [Aureimonas glaciei]|uniref:Uncharacterized protein n=1 Tax=Aureimonas glaciei TaxID=1776957 RepID=A0A916XSQ1_9HYPH|nr:hypothetical protein [Aureimonas glaciei]GGD04948.1 hypothetical protein GCM10011335_04720 [Aureimonas glaciei]